MYKYKKKLPVTVASNFSCFNFIFNQVLLLAYLKIFESQQVF